MRFEGTLKTWHDDRGFGFIEPSRGGQEIFVHVKAFRAQSVRPQLHQRVSFEIEIGPQGKKRAKNVDFIRQPANRGRSRAASPVKWGGASLFAVPGFVVIYFGVSLLWRVPLVFAATYAGLSLLTFMAYALDKSAARENAWRTPESTLHLLALAGGWPGALLAQQWLRHKSVKAEFRAVFWATVVLNVVGFVVLCSPLGRPLWASQ
ncbi:MAG: cold shock and DUF1294 domain-containing protein [Burkholderiales bacterium]|nr:cold shock and DUF1294 domain-containing protein [Burkholderiales bacterium]